MTAQCARRTLIHSSASVKTLITRSSLASKLNGISPPAKPTNFASRLSSPSKLAFSRLPVELSAAQSLMPLHSATASALFTSLLSVSNVNWGCLSEGFATPL